MGEIRFVGTGETCGYPYLVCKKQYYNRFLFRSQSRNSVVDDMLDYQSPTSLVLRMRLEILVPSPSDLCVTEC